MSTPGFNQIAGYQKEEKVQSAAEVSVPSLLLFIYVRRFQQVPGFLFFLLLQIHIAVVHSREDPEEDADNRKDDPGARPSVINEAGNQVNGRGKREDDARNDSDHLVLLGLILRELAD